MQIEEQVNLISKKYKVSPTGGDLEGTIYEQDIFNFWRITA